MTDPQRLLMLTSNGETDDLERELLASIQHVDPPADAKSAAWAKLSAQIAAVAVVSTAHSAAAATAASTGVSTAAGAAAEASAGAAAKTGLLPLIVQAFTAKVAIGVGVASVAVGAGAFWVHEHRGAPSVVPTPAAVATLNAVPSAPAIAPPVPLPPNEPAALPTDTPQTSALPEPASSRRITDQGRRDQLSAESTLLTQARAQLRNGDARGAQQSFARLQA